MLRALKAWTVDLNATTNHDVTPLCYPVGDTCNWTSQLIGLPTAQHLILLGAQVRPVDLRRYSKGMRKQLMAWADDHLAWHHTFTCTVLHAIHDDGSHTAENQTNWLAHLSGFCEFRICVADYLGIRFGAEHRALGSAKAVWLAFEEEGLVSGY